MPVLSGANFRLGRTGFSTARMLLFGPIHFVEGNRTAPEASRSPFLYQSMQAAEEQVWLPLYSLPAVFLRRFRRSLIHLRISGL